MLTARSAFIVQVDDEAADRLEGRVEHVLSGLSIDFASPQALLDFLKSQVTAQPTAVAGEAADAAAVAKTTAS